MANKRNSSPAFAAEALEKLGALSLRIHSMESVLQTVAEVAKEVMPSETEASVLLMIKDSKTTFGSTGQLAIDLDETQFERGHGPCLHAARTGELTEISDTRTEARWPDYVAHAVEKGNLSSLSVPLPIDEDEQVRGALNIYARDAHAFDAESRVAATKFAPYAGVAAANMYALHSARSEAENLQLALVSRAVIDQAKGILMERHKLTADQAFQVLVQVSTRTNTKLRKVADHLVHTGELPRP